MFWEAVFLLVVLKIPVIYLCAVVWWAIKAEPDRPETTDSVPLSDTPPSPSWQHRWSIPRRPTSGRSVRRERAARSRPIRGGTQP
jgi:hypothetical protein